MKKFFLFSLSNLALSVAFFAQAQNPFVLDPTFGSNGVSVTPNPLFGNMPYRTNKIWNMQVASNDKIVLGTNIGAVYAPEGVSSDYCLTRLTADGALDTTFNGTGRRVFNATNQPAKMLDQLLVLPDQKILYAGNIYVGGASKLIIYKFKEDGSNDVAFGNAGSVQFGGNKQFNWIYAMGIQTTGKIIALADNLDNISPSNGLIIRLNENGSLDNTFSPDGTIAPTLGFPSNQIMYRMIRVLPDNSFLVVGTHVAANNDRSNFLAKLDQNGVLQTNFGTNGRVALPTDSAEFLTFYHKNIDVDHVGNIYVTCASSLYLPPAPVESIVVYKYSATGVAQTAYGQNGRVTLQDGVFNNMYFFDALVHDNDKLVIGAMKDTGVNAQYMLQRLNADGTPDLGFSANAGQISGTRYAFDHFGYVGLQSDNRLLLGGYGQWHKNGGDTLMPVVMRFRDSLSVTSLRNVKYTQHLKIYPNPTTDILYIEGARGALELQVMDISGRTLRSMARGASMHSVDCSVLAPGIYLLKITEKDAQRSSVVRFVKK